MIKRKITFIRRIIQITAFILVFYGGWLFGLKRLQITWWAFEQNKTKAIKLDYDNPTHTQSLQTFLPTRSCRFAGNTGIFRGCMMFFLSDILTWHPPLEKILPHLILLLVLMIVFGRIWPNRAKSLHPAILPFSSLDLGSFPRSPCIRNYGGFIG